MTNGRERDTVGAGRFGRVGAASTIVLLAAGTALWACGTSDPGTRTQGSTASRPPQRSVVDGYVKLARGVHPAARPELERGPLDPGKHLANLSLVFKLSPAQRAERDALKAAQLDPGSPSYHKWLTPEEYAARFGAPPADIERAKSWLASQGLDVHEASRLGSRVTFSGSVANVQSAFRAPMRRYEIGGAMHYAMSAPAQVPAELADVVLDVVNTHDFYPRPMSRRADASPVVPDYANGGTTGFTPPDWANVYDVAKLYTTGVGGTPVTGAGVTIAVVGVAQIAQSDVAAWRTKFGLPASPVTMTLVPNTGAAKAGSGGTGFEAVLDVEWTGGIGTGATINYVYTGADDGNVDDATYYIIENNLGAVLSESWGGCDGEYLQSGETASDENVIDVYGSAANLLGITYVAASGDSGATSCINFGLPGLYVNTPAAYPGVTAVGGTQFAKGSLTGTPYFTAYSSAEAVWNEAHTGTGTNPSVAAGGGGISSIFSRPDYQTGIPTCTIVGSLPVAGVTAANMREVPDVSFTSAGVGNAEIPLFEMCTQAGGDCSGTGGNPTLSAGGGTSFATPAFAGVVALLNQAAGGRLGNINPVLYALNASNASAFHDVATGNNEVTCTSAADPGCGAGNLYGYAAKAGYDCGVGLGSLDVYNLVSAWHGLAPTTTTLSATPTTSSEGAPVDLSATIAVPTPNGSALGGTVTFTFQTYTDKGAPDLSWTLGTSGITAPMVSGGSAALASRPIPPGLVLPGAQYADVYAEYGGDSAHQASRSAKVRITFAPPTLCISPASGTLATTGALQFAAAGGTAPVKWYVSFDSTCNTAGTTCSTLDETTGAFKAGPTAGYVVVSAIDANGAEQIANLTVGAATGSPPWGDAGVSPGSCTVFASDAGTGPDSGTTTADSGAPADSGAAGQDSGATADASPSADASSPGPDGSSAGDDGGTDGSASGDAGTSPGSSGGCGCKVAQSREESSLGGLAVFVLGLGLSRRRRRR